MNDWSNLEYGECWNDCLYCRETRTGNNLYQELSFQDAEALGDVDEGADITGKNLNFPG